MHKHDLARVTNMKRAGRKGSYAVSECVSSLGDLLYQQPTYVSGAQLEYAAKWSHLWLYAQRQRKYF